MNSTNSTLPISSEIDEQQEILLVNEQINLIWQEIYSIYTQLGKKYATYVSENGDIPEIGTHELLVLINEKYLQIQELENKITDILFN